MREDGRMRNAFETSKIRIEEPHLYLLLRCKIIRKIYLGKS